MFDIQKLMDAMNESRRLSRSGYHLTLSGLIDALRLAPADMLVRTDAGQGVGDADSYRGYYSDLALDPVQEAGTVAALLKTASAALGTTFNGYKGGDFVMGPDTPLWVAPYGCCGPAIVGYEIADGAMVLKTKEID